MEGLLELTMASFELDDVGHEQRDTRSSVLSIALSCWRASLYGEREAAQRRKGHRSWLRGGCAEVIRRGSRAQIPDSRQVRSGCAGTARRTRFRPLHQGVRRRCPAQSREGSCAP